MKYDKFTGILNAAIFTGSKAKLLESIARDPQRFIGLFRPTTPRVKLQQNILQSREIRMGDALEKIVRCYLQENGCMILGGDIQIAGKRKNIDLHFRQGDDVFVIEQKVRDDHDSTKKSGQIRDFLSKLENSISENGAKRTRGGIFFVDPSLSKNKGYYRQELANFAGKHDGLRVRLWYGGEFFADILGDEKVWEEILSYLAKWKEGIPNFPDVNFDADPKSSFGEIQNIPPGVFMKIFNNEEVRSEILPVLFPSGEVLEKLRLHMNSMGVRGQKVSAAIERQIGERTHEDGNGAQ